MTLANRMRGEALLSIDGADVRLCVTLGALAELEAAFDVASLAELGERLSSLSASDLLVVLSALAGAGRSARELAAARIDPQEAAAAVAAAFAAAFGDG